ncbi:MAG: UDP-N-acetylmuramate--L-alanine ligase [Eubacteriales bacterium]
MLELNKFKHIFCIGIGGIGLSALAEIFLSRGCKVSGSDMKASEITENLEQKGAVVYFSHDSNQIKGADLLIYSSAVSMDNPELKAAISAGIPTLTRAEALGLLMKEYKNSIAISGTHGKTTTTSMVSLILENAGVDPTILVGGHLEEIGGNVKIGKSSYFVTEACEYMDSFLNLSPTIEIILNIDSDHLDYFKDIEHIANSFTRFAKLVPKDGYVIAYSSNPFVSRLLGSLTCNIITFGFDDQCDYYAANIEFNAFGMPSFDLFHRESLLCSIQLSIPGEHNISNAVAAFACCHNLGISPENISMTLNSFNGTQRRFDVIGKTKKNVNVVDDYAHHPTEIMATLKAARNIPHNKLWCIFQPHTYTRTIALFDDFVSSFENADIIIFAEIYAAREKNIYKISSKELASKTKEEYPAKEVFYFDDFQDISDFVKAKAQENDLVITMGAGDIYKVSELIVKESI